MKRISPAIGVLTSLLLSTSIFAISPQKGTEATPWSHTRAMGDVIDGPYNASEDSDILTLGITQRWDKYWVTGINLRNNQPVITQLTLTGETKSIHYLQNISNIPLLMAISYDAHADRIIGLGEDWKVYSLGIDDYYDELYLKDVIDIGSHCTKYPSGIAASSDGSGRFWVIELRDAVQLNSRIEWMKQISILYHI